MSAFRSLATRPPASLETVPTFSADRIDVVSGGTAVGQRIYRIVNLYTGLDLELNPRYPPDGGTIDHWSDVSGANNEHWNLMVGGNSTCRIVHVPYSLAWTWKTTVWGTGNGSVVDQWPNNGAGSTNDFWRLAQDGNENMAAISIGI